MVDKTREDQEQDVFGDAFAEAAGSKDAPVNQDSGTDQGGDDEGKQQEKQTDEGKGEGEPKGDTGNADEGKQETAEEKATRLEEENAKLVHKTKSWEGRISAANRESAELKERIKALEEEKSKKTDEGKDTGKPASPPPEEEDEDIKSFKADYPNVAGPIEKLIASERQKIRKEMEAELGKTVDERIKPVADTVQKSNAEKHMAAIAEAHPDYKQHTDALYEWVDTQPDYLQDSMKAVLAHGNTLQVIDLLDRYKKANGITAKDEQGDQDEREDKPQPKDKRQKQADDAEAVRGKPGGRPKGRTQIDEDDFDGAFAVAIGDKT